MAKHFPQHDVVVQSLYNGRAVSSEILFKDYALAQARSDVFFSLLFGGRIVCSAGAFFDSSIAIKVFGELLSRPKFKELEDNFSWMPLTLKTDSVDASEDAIMFTAARWRNPNMSLFLFREDDSQFTNAFDGNIHAFRVECAAALEHENWIALKALLESFSIPYQIPNSDLFYFEEQSKDLSFQNKSTVPSVLSNTTHNDFKTIMLYLRRNSLLKNLDQASANTIQSIFSPYASIDRRIKAAHASYEGFYDFDDLIERAREFLIKTNESPLMNKFLTIAPGIFAHYMPLVKYWVETDWHATRHLSYQSSALIASSNWVSRDIFSFDSRTKILYNGDLYLDDSKHKQQEYFGILDWDVLLDIVSDEDWQVAQIILHNSTSSTSQSTIEKNCDRIIHFFAKKLTDFTLNVENGRLSVLQRKSVAFAGNIASAATCLSSFDSTLVAILGVGAISTIIDGAISRMNAAKIAVPGVRWSYERWSRHCLKNCIVPRLYLSER